MHELINGNLKLFDGNPKTNQCHINALQTLFVYQKYQQGGQAALSAEDQKFLILSFFTNFEVAQYRGEAVDRARTDFFIRYIDPYLAHLNPKPARRARGKYLALFCRSDLKERASEQLALMLFDFVSKQGVALDDDVLGRISPVYPKYLGAMVFLRLVAELKIPVVIKVKAGDCEYCQIFGEYHQGAVIVIQVEADRNPEPLFAEFAKLDDFMLPCAAFFTHSNQEQCIDLVHVRAPSFLDDLLRFKRLFAPLSCDILHVYTAGGL